MQNTYEKQSALSNNNAEAVVLNDTSAMPSISLEKLGVAANVKVAIQANGGLAAMERARISWETTEMAASNKRLYAILTDAYGYYRTMKLDPIKETRAQFLRDLEIFISERGYTFMPSTHDMTRVVKCVFGVDRRRVSAYSIALREALRMDISATDLSAFIEQNGGVEQIRLGGSKPLSVTKRAEMAKSEVLGSDLGMLKFDARLFAADADWADKQVVIVATYLPTGEFQANAVIKHDTAVNAALAAYYSQQQAAVRAAAKAARDSEKAERDAEKAEREAEKQEARDAAKAEKREQQQAKGLAKAAKMERDAANLAHLSTLMEDAA